ncbi:hypothetical protein COO60DRAFT_628446 [Scenedesmus sp. NREL 46B-D3]|nr:hypothetical protein COO60DRAFT_628446 [Scenedesmus sp. NREL 46B-D3]
MIVVPSPVCECGVAPHNLIPQENTHRTCCTLTTCTAGAASLSFGNVRSNSFTSARCLVCTVSQNCMSPLIHRTKPTAADSCGTTYTAVCWQLPAHTACCASTLHSGLTCQLPASIMLLINAHKATHTHCSCPTAPQCGKLCSQHTQPRHPHMHTCPQHISCSAHKKSTFERFCAAATPAKTGTAAFLQHVMVLITCMPGRQREA